MLRSRFTFYRQAGPSADGKPTELSLPLEEWYRLLQDHGVTQLNIVLSAKRSRLARAIVARMSVDDIVQELRELIGAGGIADRQKANTDRLDKILAKDSTPAEKHTSLALMLADSLPRRTLKARLK